MRYGNSSCKHVNTNMCSSESLSLKTVLVTCATFKNTKGFDLNERYFCPVL